MKPLTVDAESKLMDFLERSLTDVKKTTLKQYLKYERILVNGKIVSRHDHPLAPGDKVTFATTSPVRRMEVKTNLEVLHQDEAIIVVYKPAGLLTIATDTEKERTAYFELTAMVRASNKGDRIFIVHRLDRETSGLLVFARRESVKLKLQGNWDQVEKRYLAVVEGRPPQASGEVRSHLHEGSNMKMYSGRESRDSKLSVTGYKVLKSNGEYSLLEINLRTGRKNQIRVHCSDLGHPIVGDEKYGSKVNPVKRLALHASYLEFDHPMTGKRMVFRSKMPAPLMKLVGAPGEEAPRFPSGAA